MASRELSCRFGLELPVAAVWRSTSQIDCVVTGDVSGNVTVDVSNDGIFWVSFSSIFANLERSRNSVNFVTSSLISETSNSSSCSARITSIFPSVIFSGSDVVVSIMGENLYQVSSVRIGLETWSRNFSHASEL